MRRGLLILPALLVASVAGAQLRDVESDTWSATDGLARTVPGYAECGAPRADRQVGIFYFLWLGAHASAKAPYDVTKILAQDPDAMSKPDSPLWGPLYAAHHWGESIFGYYKTDDAYVLRRHAQMLSDAGVDVVIFDVTNQITYKPYYMALLETFAEARRMGGKTPQVAFLCPFGNPAKVVKELYADLYGPGLYSDLWYRWEGKPLILADPNMIGASAGLSQHDTPARLEAGHTLGQSFQAEHPLDAVGGCFPTWESLGAGMTLSLYRDGPDGEKLATKTFSNSPDNAWQVLKLDPPLPAGATYYLEMSQPVGTVGWWTQSTEALAGGQAFVDGKPTTGDRNLRLSYTDDEAHTLRGFFTFRKPQASYFQGPTGPDMWSWLEVYPQHVFMNSRGDKEQMTVGVAQNAVGNRLGSMSEVNAKGRSFHKGAEDTRPDAVRWGLNFEEQSQRALEEDPRFVFITGWNEWIAGRFPEFGGVKLPVMFVDEFDQEHSRDMEPMKGGHGDDYYYQLVSFVRRYKGVRKPPAAGPEKTISMDAGFEQWADVTPEFRDDAGDEAHRDHPGYNNFTRYTNDTGRNDFVTLKVARDRTNLCFYAQTRETISPCTDPRWMVLWLDTDGDPKTGWQGFDYRVNRTVRSSTVTMLERWTPQGWQAQADIALRVSGKELMVQIPRDQVGLADAARPIRLHFKWADNLQKDDDTDEFMLNGDTAPNCRFTYLYAQEP